MSAFPFIQSLLFSCRPTTIARLVIPVVINPINRKMARSAAHVSDKVVERVPPPITDLYSSCAIIVVGVAFRIVASLNHAVPNIEFSGVGEAMGRAGFFSSLNMEAATAFECRHF